MLTITFYPESDRIEFIEATTAYQRIWDNDGTKILETIMKISSLSFAEHYINALIFEGISFSNPLMLRASYPEQVKRGTLIHELCHRLLVENNINVIGQDREIGQLLTHKYVNLILFDIFSDLYGQGFAEEMVSVESARRPFYRVAWEWALSLSREERAQKFLAIRNGDSLE